MRRCREHIEVRVQQADSVTGEAAASEPQPTMFVWDGRLYVIRAVLGCWEESPGWRRSVGADRVCDRDRGEPGSNESVSGGAVLVADAKGVETVWRVEASAGRGLGVAVYDLAHRPADERQPESWVLVGVSQPGRVLS